MTKEETPFHDKLIHNIKKSSYHNEPSEKQRLMESSLTEKEIGSSKKLWDDARCPICMDHPHNAVLLLCSSYDQGCRPFMCDTSHRHSNCLDQYRKRSEKESNDASESIETVRNAPRGSDPRHRRPLNLYEDSVLHRSERSEAVSSMPRRLLNSEIHRMGDRRFMYGVQHENHNRRISPLSRDSETETGSVFSSNSQGDDDGAKSIVNDKDMKCPLCRGSVTGWTVVQDAREYLNMKERSCSRETCSFAGTYEELRKHARTVHPSTRPADVDPSRERAWRRLENQREYEDVISSIRSAVPGGVVIGDYVIDNDDDMHLDETDDFHNMGSRGPVLASFYLFHLFPRDNGRNFSQRWRGSNRLTTPSVLGRRRRSWNDGHRNSADRDETPANGAHRNTRQRLNRGRRGYD